jgi:hypothetical protein
VTFTATVTPSSGSSAPTGTVTFTDGAATVGSSTLSGGVATLTTRSLAVGTHTIVASYAGAGNFAGSTSNMVNQTVNKDGTTTTVTGAPNPVALGQSVTFTITVMPQAPGAGVATGTVTLRLPKATLGIFSVDSTGHATFTTSGLPAGTNTITATYNGDRNFLTSVGAVVQIVGAKAASTITLRSSQNPAAFGTAVTFTATVTGAGNTPTGTVSFLDAKITLATVALNSSGIATFTTSSLSIGTHNMHAQYNGSSQYNMSGSNVVSQTVTASTSNTFLAGSQAALSIAGLWNTIVTPVMPATSRPGPQGAAEVASAQPRAVLDQLAISGVFATKAATAIPFCDSIPEMDLSTVDRVFSRIFTARRPRS